MTIRYRIGLTKKQEGVDIASLLGRYCVTIYRRKNSWAKWLAWGHYYFRSKKEAQKFIDANGESTQEKEGK